MFRLGFMGAPYLNGNRAALAEAAVEGPPYPNVVVSGAGSPELDGEYSYRGEYGDFHFYNLIEQPDDPTIFAVVNGGSEWYVTDGNGSVFYKALSVTEFPYDPSNIWAVRNGEAPAPTVTSA